MYLRKRALAVLLCFALLFGISACVKYQTNYIEVNGYSNVNVSSTANQAIPSSSSTYTPSSSPVITSGAPVTESTAIPIASTTAPSVPGSSSDAPASEPTSAASTPENWSKEQIITFLGNAVNKTKAYTNDIVVKHTESFNLNIEEIKPNFGPLKTLAQSIINGVLKPTDDTVTFSGGQGVIGDGETVPLLLPKRQGFDLPAAGAATATARQDGANVVIDVTLVSEDATLDRHPVYNAGSTGYLDVGDVDLSMLTLEAFEVTYTGSTIHAVVNADGYVSYADYHMPVKIYAAGKALGFSGSFRCSAEQQEQWTLNW